jgi:hypothetical protein
MEPMSVISNLAEPSKPPSIFAFSVSAACVSVSLIGRPQFWIAARNFM